jgi:drug/metabolite transporter (DMT)-like permease
MKAVAADVAPTMQLAIRFCGAAIFFGVWVFVREGGAAFADGTLGSGVLLGSLFSLEFIFVGEALAHTTAAHTIVFLYAAPIFTALGLQFLPEEHLRPVQWAGISVAFLGIVVAFLGRPGRPSSQTAAGDLLALLGGVSWGLSNVVLRRGRVGTCTTQKTVFYQVGMAAVLLLAFAARTGETRVVLSPAVVLGLLFQTAIISIASYLAPDADFWRGARRTAAWRSDRAALCLRHAARAGRHPDRQRPTDSAALVRAGCYFLMRRWTVACVTI